MKKLLHNCCGRFCGDRLWLRQLAGIADSGLGMLAKVWSEHWQFLRAAALRGAAMKRAIETRPCHGSAHKLK